MGLKLWPISIFLLIYSDVYSCYYGYRGQRDLDTIVMVHVIFRHGDRTPDVDAAKSYPNNPYRNITYFPYGNGQLTLRGKKRAYFLGEGLRRRFNRFLGPVYYPEILEAWSSELDRSQMSLQLVLAALFPPSKEYEISRYLYWQPIPYKYLPLENDKLIALQKVCPEIFRFSPEGVDNKTQEMYKYVSEHVGAEINNSLDLLLIQNTIQVQEELGLRVPYWARRIWPEPFTGNALRAWIEITNHSLPDIVGNLLHKIVEDTKAFIDNKPSPKMYLYSGHDVNIVAVLSALGAYNGQYIKYSSHVIMEVHRINGAYGFKIFVQNWDNEYPKLFTIANCGSFCPFDVIERLADKFYKGDRLCPDAIR